MDGESADEMTSISHDNPSRRDKRAMQMYDLWKSGKSQKDIADSLGISPAWVSMEIRRMINSGYGSDADRRLRVRSVSIAQAKRSEVRRARRLSRYRMIMQDVINGMTVNECAHKYGRSYQTIMRVFSEIRRSDPQLYEQYVAANRSHRFGWSKRRQYGDADAE